jgi:hypothetical protein
VVLYPDQKPGDRHRGTAVEISVAAPVIVLTVMGQIKGVVEIPRGVTAHIYKLLDGLALLGTVPLAVTAHIYKLLDGLALLGIVPLVVTDVPAEWLLGLVVSSPFAAVGLLFTAGHAAALIRRRTPQLRATRAGLWFGAGAIIPWHDVAAIYAEIPIEPYGSSARTSAIVRFHRARTLLRLPCSLWLTTLAIDTVKVSLLAAADPTAIVLAQLEALRLATVGHGDGAMPGSGGLPAARIVRE